MDPKRLLIFRGIARTGSISAAARELGWTQPAVSQHLRALEREVGSALLLRTPSGVELTEPGRALLAHADAVAGQLHLAGEELAAMASLRAGTVRLAAYPSAAASLVPVALARLRERAPGVDVALTEAEPPEAVAALNAGDVDVALVFGYHDDLEEAGTRLRWTHLGDEPVHLVLPPRHHLARGRVTMRSLEDEQWIVGCQRCRAHTVELCQAAGFMPTIQHTSDDYVVVQNLVVQGLGVSFLPEMALAAFRHPDVVVRESAAWGRRTYGVVHREGAEQVPATAALLEELGCPRWGSNPD